MVHKVVCLNEQIEPVLDSFSDKLIRSYFNRNVLEIFAVPATQVAFVTQMDDVDHFALSFRTSS